MEALESDEATKLFEGLMKDHFGSITKIKKNTRLKVSGEIEQKLIALCHSPALLESVAHKIVGARRGLGSRSGGGILLTPGRAIPIVKFNGRWYEFINEISYYELLTSVVNVPTANNIIRATKRALAKIRRATTYNDTKPWNTPIILNLHPDFEKEMNSQE